MRKKDAIAKDGFNEILLYTTPNGKVKVEIFLRNETIWLTQQKIADLFGVDRTVVTRHIGNIFRSGELDEQVVCAKFAHTTQHGAIAGKTQESVTKFYNLDAIISVGLPSKQHAGHTLSYLGDRAAEGIHNQGLYDG